MFIHCDTQENTIICSSVFLTSICMTVDRTGVWSFMGMASLPSHPLKEYNQVMLIHQTSSIPCKKTKQSLPTATTVKRLLTTSYCVAYCTTTSEPHWCHCCQLNKRYTTHYIMDLPHNSNEQLPTLSHP